MKLAICGPGRSGKDMAAEWLRDHTTLRYVAGTSYWARHLVFAAMRAKGMQYADADDCWRDRHNHRQWWAQIIGEYNRDDPAKLYRDCITCQDLLTGIRWRHELRAVRAAELVDLWVWIERPGIAVDPTMEFGPEECDFIIRNDGSEVAYFEKWAKLARAWGVLNPPTPAIDPAWSAPKDCDVVADMLAVQEVIRRDVGL